MGLGSYILYLRSLKEGVTPREVAAELEMPEHYIHAIELEKHAGNGDSRGKLAEYFEIPVEEFNDYARSTYSRFMEILKKERRPQMGFLLMNGQTLQGTVDGADTSIVKIVELNSGMKTILQRHAIKKWWPLKTRSERSEGGGYEPRGDRGGEGRPPVRRPGGGGSRPPMRPGGGGGRPAFNQSGPRPGRPFGERPDPGNEREAGSGRPPSQT